MIDFTKYTSVFDRRVQMPYTVDLFRQEYGNLPQGDQNYAELSCLIDIYKDIQPLNVLEIGSEWGGSLKCWSVFKSFSTKIISIDISETFHSLCRTNVLDPEIVYITRPSGLVDTVTEVKKVCPTIQFLFIDGLHGLENVRQDYTLYSPLVCAGGIIAFHDVSDAANCGTTQFWREIKLGAHYVEFINTNISTGTGSGWGIGVMEVT